MSERSVLSSTAAAAADVSTVGGKAANLARLESAGAATAPWVVIIADVLARLGDADAELPPDLVQAVRSALEGAGIGDRLLAVRSSAVGEDAEGASFAGQFETVVGVRARDDAALWDAVRTVWRSASAERVLAYAADSRPPRIAVILQALVDARAAGVAFSADPVTGDPGTAVISAVHGLGEALVSGEVDADTFRVTVGTRAIVERKIVAQDRALRGVPGGAEWVYLTAEEGTAPAVTDDEVLAIAAAAADLAAKLGRPQDVEWALDLDGRLVVLQTRPITALGGGREGDASGDRRIWDNSNIVESYAGVTTPLTFSFARAVYEDVYRQFCSVMGVEDELIERHREMFAAMLGLIRGRVYYNLLNWYRMLALLPGYAFNRAFMERMMGVREKLSDPPEPQLVAGKWQDLGRLVRMVARMVRSSRGLKRDVPAFHARVDGAIAPLADEDLSAWTADDLLRLYRRLEGELLRHWRPPLVNDFFAMLWFGVLGRLVESWLPDEPPTLVNDLLAGEGGIISTEPARRVMALAAIAERTPEVARLFDVEPDDAAVLARLDEAVRRVDADDDPGPDTGAEPDPAVLAAFRGQLTDYLRKFGDRCANELKLETVTLSDDPVFLVASVRAYRRQGATDPGESREREREIRRSAEARVRAGLKPSRRPLFGFVLRHARSRIRDRENLRFERTRVFGVVRRIFLGLGARMVDAGRLDSPRDVFWLTAPEVFGWVDGTGSSADLRALAAARRSEFEEYEGTPPPPERFETYGPPTEADLAAAGSEAAEGDLEGTGCCPGVVRAPVRIVRDPREAGDLEGCILVAERTDPGWTLLFPAAKGLLVQRGSLLSHSAIVAREMGLPCVVAIPGLLDTLEDGEVVEMDGTTGVVRREGSGRGSTVAT